LFYTVVTDRRWRILAEPPARSLLGSVFRRCLVRWPCELPAIMRLLDHGHAIWSLPPGDRDFCKRWGGINNVYRRLAGSCAFGNCHH
jgi:putative transposase